MDSSTSPPSGTTDQDTAKHLISSEIEKHTTRDDLWMVIGGKVYNVTNFIDEHPGGEEVLIDCGGTDATSAFEDVGHSDDAIELLDGMLIGTADPTEFKRKLAGAQTIDSPSESSSLSMILLILAAIVAGVGFVYLQLNK